MINQQPKSFVNNLDTLFAKNQQTFTSNEISFKSEVDSGFEGNCSETDVRTKPDIVPLKADFDASICECCEITWKILYC